MTLLRNSGRSAEPMVTVTLSERSRRLAFNAPASEAAGLSDMNYAVIDFDEATREVSVTAMREVPKEYPRECLFKLVPDGGGAKRRATTRARMIHLGRNDTKFPPGKYPSRIHSANANRCELRFSLSPAKPSKKSPRSPKSAARDATV